MLNIFGSFSNNSEGTSYMQSSQNAPSFRKRFSIWVILYPMRELQWILAKIKAIKEWPASRNVHEVTSLMGLVGYCRNFVAIFSRIAYPITSLQRKGKHFEWTEKCQRVFELLKELLTIALIFKSS